MSASPRSLDAKLARIRDGRYSPADFVIADAKDGDMSMGVVTPGMRDGRPRSIAEYRAAMRDMIASGLVDIMLTSQSSAEALAGACDGTPITPAIRLNDATDIWGFRGACYRSLPAAPFRTARIDRARALADLGLYAVTFYNDLARDVETLERYAAFRDEASAVGMRHFLEVFNPNFPIDTGDAAMGDYINDAIARCLAGVARADRPLFLKMPYNGARQMEELAAFDPANLIVGILGGAAGTTRDTFELVSQAERHGARIALFGRKIYFAEDQVEIVAAMRRVVERVQTPEDAVRDYHSRLAKKGKEPARPLAADLEITEAVLK